MSPRHGSASPASALWHALRAALLALALFLPCTAAADHERWYVIDMAGGRAGWCHVVQKTTADRITSTTELTFKIGRAEKAVSLGMKSEFVETLAHKPVSLRTEMRLGNQPTRVICTYGEKEIQITTISAAGEERSTHPLPEGEWLTPAAAGEFVRKRLEAGATTIELRTIDAMGALDAMSALTPVITTHSDCRPEELDILGKKIKVTRSIVTSSAQPRVQSTEYLDAQGIPVKSETSLRGISIAMTASTRQEAMAERAGPEMMTTTFVTPDRPIPNARATTHAVYLVSVPDGKLPAFPATGLQQSTTISDREARIEVRRTGPTPAPEADAADPVFTKPSSTINSDDQVIRDLAARAVKGADSAAAKAEALRRFVHAHISEKDLGVGFGSASETARTRRGDCTEHGVLLAAMLRTQGIPARVACGLIYADGFAGSRNIFGYHMWSQALLEIDGKPRWVDLDATLDDQTPFDATHITLAVSPLGDGQTQDALLSIATIIGRLQIKVETIK